MHSQKARYGVFVQHLQSELVVTNMTKFICSNSATVLVNLIRKTTTLVFLGVQGLKN